MSNISLEEEIALLRAKILRLQGVRRVVDYFPNNSLVELLGLPKDVVETYGNMTLEEFVAAARASARLPPEESAKNVGGLQAIAGALGLPRGVDTPPSTDELWVMPGPEWEPRDLNA